MGGSLLNEGSDIHGLGSKGFFLILKLNMVET